MFPSKTCNNSSIGNQFFTPNSPLMPVATEYTTEIHLRQSDIIFPCVVITLGIAHVLTKNQAKYLNLFQLYYS